jgi:RNA polymerase subunit RPABC4/transcription elongation factor Spt4
MSTYQHCDNCQGEITPDSDFCPHCGMMFVEVGEVSCDSHPDRRGWSVCIICRKIVCDQCGTLVGGRAFCPDHCMVHVQQDWAEVFSSADVEEAELRKSVLESNGFTVQVQNFQSVGYVWGGGGDSIISRSNLGRPALVFVPIPEFVKAAETLAAWEEGTIEESQSNA